MYLQMGLESSINSHKAKQWLFTIILCLTVTFLMLTFTSKCKSNVDYLAVW